MRGGPARMRGVRRFLWEAVRFVCAVSRVRMAPRRRREEGAGSACRARPHLCAAIWRREVPYRKRRFIKRSSPVRAVDSVGKRYRSMTRGFFWEISARQDSGVWERGLFASRVSASAAGSSKEAAAL